MTHGDDDSWVKGWRRRLRSVSDSDHPGERGSEAQGLDWVVITGRELVAIVGNRIAERHERLPLVTVEGWLVSC